MNQKYLIGIIIAVAVIGGVVLYTNSTNNKNGVVNSEKMTAEQMMKDEKSAEENKTMEADKMKQESIEKTGGYQDYSPALVTSEQKAGNKVVLFFHASWCPYCKAADTAFKANLDKIPGKVTVLKTDYDTNEDLKNKYGVTTQHTFVQIDNEGNQVTKWVGGDIDALVKNIK